ncbi:MAG TPA: hypothetical protein VHA70_05515 [Bauldia sp.]|nr:hypothetical protein [Bauldia sp.]
MRRVKPTLSALAFVASAIWFTPIHAEERQTAGDPRASVWGLDPDSSSAVLARDGWKFLGMSTLSWPDGRQAVVTMWNSKLGDFARCFDYFDAKMNQTGGKCERSGTGL